MPQFCERRTLPYTPEQMYNLVMDIDKYPQFLPWCVAGRITKKEQLNNSTILRADLTIGYKLLRESFVSRVQATAPHSIMFQYENGPFKFLTGSWRFAEHPQGCVVDFCVDFEFKVKLLHHIIASVFTEASKMMVAAFQSRAAQLYSPLTTTPLENEAN